MRICLHVFFAQSSLHTDPVLYPAPFPGSLCIYWCRGGLLICVTETGVRAWHFLQVGFSEGKGCALESGIFTLLQLAPWPGFEPPCLAEGRKNCWMKISKEFQAQTDWSWSLDKADTCQSSVRGSPRDTWIFRCFRLSLLRVWRSLENTCRFLECKNTPKYRRGIHQGKTTSHGLWVKPWPCLMHFKQVGKAVGKGVPKDARSHVFIWP